MSNDECLDLQRTLGGNGVTVDAKQPISILAPAFVVGLGASAGGLEALERFFDNMPADNGMAFIVVQHLSPDYKSLMVELLSKHTEMKVFRADDGMQVERNCIYLLPPKKNIIIEHGVLQLPERAPGSAFHLPIDIFFRSLAEDQGERAVGIVLSGTGSDGMRGIRALKESGGVIFAQDEVTAKFDGMPRSAVSTGIVDYVLPPESMPAQLMNYARSVLTGTRLPAPLIRDDGSLSIVLGLLRRQTGVDFTYYKPATVLRRIERRMHLNQTESLETYAHFVEQNPREVTSLYKELLIGVTKFFRDSEAFELLRSKVIPTLVDECRTDEGIRVWIAGCATGEEAYSIAMLFVEYLDTCKRAVDVKIFATDIDKEAIEFASNGVYPESIAADVSMERLKRFFIKRAESYQVSRQLRQLVLFAVHNIIKDPPFTRMDLISCRNLLIYLEQVLQRKVLSFFHFALKPGRFLFQGRSETIGDLTEYFIPVDAKWKIYRGTGVARILPTDKIPLGASLVPGIPLARTESRVRVSEETLIVERAYQALVAEFAPTTLLVNESHQLLHVFGDASVYLRIPPGDVSLNVLKLLPKGLSALLSAAIHKAIREQKSFVYQDLRLDDTQELVQVTIRPLGDANGRRFALIMIQKSRPSVLDTDNAEFVSLGQQAEQRLLDLQQELQYTKENLQATIEELETSNEELQATNEELLASNEELQSTNEELQGVNEELYTVNAEYQVKIQELTELNNDIDNLFQSTRISAIFLDDQLHIRRFTPAVTEEVNVMARDLGRPFEHISLNIPSKGIIDDLRTVMASRKMLERDIELRNGNVLSMRIAPYLTEEFESKGVLLAFIDITSLRNAEKRWQRLLDAFPWATAILNGTGTVLISNGAWNQLHGLTNPFPSVPLGKSIIAAHREASGPMREVLWRVADGIQSVLSRRLPSFSITIHADEHEHVTLHANPLAGEEGSAVVSYITVVLQPVVDKAALPNLNLS